MRDDSYYIFGNHQQDIVRSGVLIGQATTRQFSILKILNLKLVISYWITHCWSNTFIPQQRGSSNENNHPYT